MSTPYTRQGDEGIAPGSGVTEVVLDGQLVVGEEARLILPLRFVYRANDPYAVTLQFPGGHGEAPAIAWEFSRELLAEGLRRPAGLGDVRIWPPCRCGRGYLRIRLRRPEGAALLEIPFGALRTWLVSHSFALVPEGAEGRWIDWDADLARLRGGL